MNNFKEFMKLIKTKKYKTISFFGFYLIFFIFLFIFLSGVDGSSNNKPSKPLELEIYSTKRLEENNYNYKITIQENDHLIIINNDLELSESKYNKIINLYDIKRILKNSKYLAKTKYTDDSYIINYEINNKDLYNILYNEEFRGENLVNKIIINTLNNSDVTSFSLDFSNFYQYVDENIKTLKVEIEYEY